MPARRTTTDKTKTTANDGDRDRQKKKADILTALKVGATYKVACEFARVGYTTFHEWREKDAVFAENVEAATATCAVHYLTVIQAAANEGDWKAASWLLERRWPEDYGRQIKEVEGTLGVVQLPPSDNQQWQPPQ